MSGMNESSVDISSISKQSAAPLTALNDRDLHFFCMAIERIAGISLKPTKRDLVMTRLRSRVASTRTETYSGYRKYLESLPADHEEWQHFINLLTTNKTDFFREAQHFDYLVSQILPIWMKSNQAVFNVWSAASSTGEEAYTLAMVLDRNLPDGRSFRVYGTDIDTNVVRSARNAVYQAHRRIEIPSDYHQCLDFGRGSVQNWFRIKKHIKDHVIFDQHNLIDPNAPLSDKFDLILCRNVLIYFAHENIGLVCRKLYSMAKNGGHLFIGHSESFQGISHSWTSIGPSVYQKKAS